MIITQTPLRVSFFGGGTDLPGFFLRHGGAVLSTTIDKYVYIIVKARYDERIVLNYSEREIVQGVDEIRHGIIRECMKLVGIEKGIEITSIADVPSRGSGLGSSSSFTVGLLNALYAYRGDYRSPRDLAETACRVEIELLGEPIGKQDQYAAAFGGFQTYEFRADGAVTVTPVAMDATARRALQGSCFLFYTGQMRKASSVLEEQKARIEQTSESLCRMRDIAAGSGRLFSAGDVVEIGRLLNESWKEKKGLSRGVSSSSLDAWHEKAIAAGAWGGKLLGAGGGGFFLFVAPPEKRQELTRSLDGLRELEFAFCTTGSRIVFHIDDGVGRIF